MVELVMLDADGVLFESDHSNIAYYNEIFRIVGEQPLTPEEERLCVFMSAREVFELRAGGNEAIIARTAEVAARIDFLPFFNLLRPALELRPFLLEIKRRYRLGLATNRSATVPGLIEHLNLGGLFDAVACLQDRVRPKPAPDILHLCLERASVTPRQAVYVGDSQIDHEAAQAAGVSFIGVGPRVRTQLLIERLHDLPGALVDLAATA